MKKAESSDSALITMTSRYSRLLFLAISGTAKEAFVNPLRLSKGQLKPSRLDFPLYQHSPSEYEYPDSGRQTIRSYPFSAATPLLVLLNCNFAFWCQGFPFFFNLRTFYVLGNFQGFVKYNRAKNLMRQGL